MYGRGLGESFFEGGVCPFFVLNRLAAFLPLGHFWLNIARAKQRVSPLGDLHTCWLEFFPFFGLMAQVVCVAVTHE